MDVLLTSASIFDLPSNLRVGSIVYDGAADVSLWPGPGSDKDLAAAYGGGLQEALDTQLKQAGVDELPIGGTLRMHPGKLHCDFLTWVATRTGEKGKTQREVAPHKETLREAVMKALEFCAGRDVVKVAFPALGSGPGELEPVERIEVIIKTAHAYEEACYKAGKPPVIESVIVCEPRAAVLAAAKKRAAALAKTVAAAPAAAAAPEKPAKPKRTRAASPKGASSSKLRAVKKTLDADEILRARMTAGPYDRTNTYSLGQCFLHSKFGVGRVDEVTAEGAIMVLFEDGERRKMVHGRV